MNERKKAIRVHLERQHAASWPVLLAIRAEDEQLPVYQLEDQEWSVHALVSHLADAEKGILGQVKRLVSGETTVSANFDLERWNRSAVRRAADQSLPQLLSQIEQAHREALVFLEQLDDQQLDLKGLHSLGDIITAEQFLTRIADHRAEHCADIQRSLRV